MSEQVTDLSTDPAPERKPKTLEALRHRDFRLIFLGQALSVVGDGAYLTVLAWFTFRMTDSAGAVAAVLGVITTSKLLVLLVGGALADRYDRRALMLASDLVRGVAVLMLTLATWQGVRSVALLIVIAALVGMFDSVFNPAFMGIVPSLVDKPLYPSANALIGFVRSSRGVAGPALGGALYAALGPTAVFGLNAATFFLAALLVSRTRPSRQERPTGGGARNTFRQIAEGSAYVRSMPILAISIPVAAVAMMLADAPTQTLLPKLVRETFGGGALTLAAFETAIGLGMASGALLCARINPTRRRAIVVYGAWTASHVTCAVLVLSPWVPLATALFFLRGLLTGFGIVLWETLLMELVPADKLSRVFSVDTFGSTGMLPLGFALAGVMAPLADAGVLIGVGQAVAAVLMISLLAVRRIRSVQ
ncbi:MFS transporter [Streptomyces sp. NPDC057702]|uniref:MFS transporter n=1 Tax=unclassified Streptomyces TaxID=2593676 RepID=UPI0036A78323